MAQKFLLNGGQFKMGNVILHMELSKDHSTTEGGGRFYIDREQKCLFLWGESVDYGYAEPENIKKHILESHTISPSLDGYKVMHSPMIQDGIPDEDTFTELLVLKLITEIEPKPVPKDPTPIPNPNPTEDEEE